MMTWTMIEKLEKQGHRLFRWDGAGPNAGRYAIADASGRTPSQTDDGVLWLDKDEPLKVALGNPKTNGYSAGLHVIVPLDQPQTSWLQTSWMMCTAFKPCSTICGVTAGMKLRKRFGMRVEHDEQTGELLELLGFGPEAAAQLDAEMMRLAETAEAVRKPTDLVQAVKHVLALNANPTKFRQYDQGRLELVQLAPKTREQLERALAGHDEQVEPKPGPSPWPDRAF